MHLLRALPVALMRLPLALLAAQVCSGCQRGEQPAVELLAVSEGGSESAGASAAPALAPASVPPAPAEAAPSLEVAFEVAQAAIEEVLRQPGLEPPLLGPERAQVVGRAKGEPALFVRRPEYSATDIEDVRYLRTRLESNWHTWERLLAVRSSFRRNPEIGRQVLLREGYLYAEQPNSAFAQVSLVGVDWLFSEPRVWIQRGEIVMRAERRRGGEYYYTDGPLEGGVVRLVLFDRIGTGEGPESEPLHRDLRSLRERLHFERMTVRRATDTHIVADLRYGDELWVPSLLVSNGARLELVHELVRPEEVPLLANLRAQAKRRQRGVGLLRQAIAQQVQEGLPFDEPKNEIGQEDGKLRPEWKRAYLAGHTTFKYRDDRYPVFGRQGQPLIPQVCVDFLVDTIERASGSWWAAKGAPVRQRLEGSFEFRDISRVELRRARSFVEFAASKPEWFEVLDVPERDRIELGKKEQFFRFIERRASDYQVGDIIFIRGHTPWDDVEMHTHTFFIYESDPVTGMPTLIAGNAGRPQVWSWEAEARRTPNRTVRHRVRPMLELLDLLVAGREVDFTMPAPVAPPSDD